MVQLPEASGIAETPGRTTPAPGVTEWPANEREDAAHAIAYGTPRKLQHGDIRPTQDGLGFAPV